MAVIVLSIGNGLRALDGDLRVAVAQRLYVLQPVVENPIRLYLHAHHVI
jgi:hypothetical protein